MLAMTAILQNDHHQLRSLGSKPPRILIWMVDSTFLRLPKTKYNVRPALRKASYVPDDNYVIQSVLFNSPPVGKGSQGGLLGRIDT